MALTVTLSLRPAWCVLNTPTLHITTTQQPASAVILENRETSLCSHNNRWKQKPAAFTASLTRFITSHIQTHLAPRFVCFFLCAWVSVDAVQYKVVQVGTGMWARQHKLNHAAPPKTGRGFNNSHLIPSIHSLPCTGLCIMLQSSVMTSEIR